MGLAAYATARGLSQAEILECTGLGLSELLDPEARLPALAVHRLWRELATRLAAHGDASVPVLVRWLDDPARNVRETAAHALGNLAPRTPEVVKALAARLEDPDDYVRWKVIRALGRQRGVAREYLPAIRAIAEATRETEVVRAAAERAVLEIQEGP